MPIAMAFLKKIFIYWAASGLCCGTWDLHCGMWAFVAVLIVVHGLFVAARGLLSSSGMRVFSL